MATRLPASAYRSYVASPAWEQRKEWWRDHRSRRRRRCRVCGHRRYDLHHRTYRRLGGERLRDLVPLCRRHHDGLHAYQARKGMTVERATRWYLGRADVLRSLPVLAAVVVLRLAVALVG